MSEATGRKLRIGVLGCGPIAQCAHLDACRKARNAELYAICDAAADLVEAMGAIHEPKRRYMTYEEMLADRDVEAVIVAVSDAFHIEAAARALRGGKHVLVEKPLGVHLEECRGLRGVLAESGMVLQVGNNRRFDPGVEFAARFAREELGAVLALKAWYCDSTFRYTMTDNLQPIIRRSGAALRPAVDPKSDRKRYLLMTHGSHLVDTARHLGGRIERVRARHLSKCDAHHWFVDVEYASGALGHLDLSIPVQGDFQEGFQVWGEAGSIIGRIPLPWYHQSSVVECFSARDRTFRRLLGEDAHTYKRQVEGFAATILEGRPQQGATLEDGIAAMEALVAIARGTETGEWVALGETEGGV